MMWMTSRGLLKGAWPIIILFGVVAILAAVGVTQYVAGQGLDPAEQSRPYIKGTDIEIHRVYDYQTGLCFIVVEGSGAFQVDCTPRFKNLAGGLQDRAQTLHSGPFASN